MTAACGFASSLRWRGGAVWAVRRSEQDVPERASDVGARRARGTARRASGRRLAATTQAPGNAGESHGKRHSPLGGLLAGPLQRFASKGGLTNGLAGDVELVTDAGPGGAFGAGSVSPKTDGGVHVVPGVSQRPQRGQRLLRPASGGVHGPDRPCSENTGAAACLSAHSRNVNRDSQSAEATTTKEPKYGFPFIANGACNSKRPRCLAKPKRRACRTRLLISSCISRRSPRGTTQTTANERPRRGGNLPGSDHHKG